MADSNQVNPRADSPKMNPSTYQQVRENMQKLAAFIGEGDVEITLEELYEMLTTMSEQINNILKIINPEPGSGSDLVPDAEGNLQVYGVTLVTQFADSDTIPSTYTRDVTFELKKFSAIGLTEKDGFTRPYGLVVTYRYNPPVGVSVNPYNYLPQQIAYNDEMTAFARISVDAEGTAWGEWNQVSGATDSSSIIDRPTEPGFDEQKEGDYWFKGD